MLLAQFSDYSRPLGTAGGMKAQEAPAAPYPFIRLADGQLCSQFAAQRGLEWQEQRTLRLPAAFSPQVLIPSIFNGEFLPGADTTRVAHRRDHARAGLIAFVTCLLEGNHGLP
jgi:hypothetical protein